jgi:hypothetical protein
MDRLSVYITRKLPLVAARAFSFLDRDLYLPSFPQKGFRRVHYPCQTVAEQRHNLHNSDDDDGKTTAATDPHEAIINTATFFEKSKMIESIIYPAQADWPSHAETIREELSLIQGQILQLQQHERKYYPLITASSSSSSSSSSLLSSLRCSNTAKETEEWRAKMCEWMFQLLDHFELDREVATVAIYFLDQSFHPPQTRQALWMSLQTKPLSIHHYGKYRQKNYRNIDSSCSSSVRFYQWLAVTCLYLAIKMVSPFQLRCRTLCQLTNGNLTPYDIVTMERNLLRVLNWQVHPPTAMQYVTLFLRFLVLTYANKNNNKKKKSKHQHATTVGIGEEDENEIANTADGHVSSDDDDDLDDDPQVVWQKLMVESSQTLSNTARYATEVKVFLDLPSSNGTTTAAPPSVWAMAAVWCALEKYQADHRQVSPRNNKNNNIVFCLWRDLIWHHLLPLLDMKWNAVQQVCRLLRPILFPNQAPTPQVDYYSLDDDVSFQTIPKDESVAPTAICDDDAAAPRFGGKTSPTSVLEVPDEHEHHKSGSGDYDHEDLSSANVPGDISHAEPPSPPNALWSTKREALMRQMLDSKRQKRVMPEAPASSVEPGGNDGHGNGTAATRIDSSAKGEDSHHGTTDVSAPFARRSTEDLQPTVAAALSAECTLTAAVHGHGADDDCNLVPLTQCEAVDPTDNHSAEDNFGSAIHATGLGAHPNDSNSNKVVASIVRRPIPRRATKGDTHILAVSTDYTNEYHDV